MAKSSTPYGGHLIIHTGDHKTGSTSIQESFARGDVTLVDGQLAYPLGKGQFNHNALFKRRRVARFIPTTSTPLAQPFQRFAKRTLQQRAEVTVMSAERLESLRPHTLAEALATHLPMDEGQLTLVTYLRPHVSRIISGLSERIKTGGARTNPWNLLEYRSRVGMRYAPRMAAWAEVFGDSHVVRPAIRSELQGGDALEDLMVTALGPGQARITQRQASNVSLGVEDLMRIQVIHRTNRRLNRTQQHALGWIVSTRLDSLRPTDAPSTPLRAHKRLAERMRRSLRADAQAVDSRYFDGRALLADALDAAVDNAETARMPLVPSAWLSASEIAALQEQAATFVQKVTGPGWTQAFHKERLDYIHARPLAMPVKE